MLPLYDVNGLVFWTSRDIFLRDMFRDFFASQISAAIRQMNPAFHLIQIEAPLLTPVDFINPNYTNHDVYVQEMENVHEKMLALRPETTPGSYIYARHLFDGQLEKPPICVWQAGKSFRREQDQPSKHVIWDSVDCGPPFSASGHIPTWTSGAGLGTYPYLYIAGTYTIAEVACTSTTTVSPGFAVGRRPLEMATDFVKALGTQVAAGNPVAPEEVQAERKRLCQGCPQYDAPKDACNSCGCGKNPALSMIGLDLELKRKWATSACPEGKWGAVS